MDILESYAELVIGTMLLVVSIFLIVENVVDPAIRQMEINYQASSDKAVTYRTEQNPTNGYMVDEEMSVFDQFNVPNFDKSDKGTSRMYFRAEQLVMMPVVDTDLTSNPNTTNGTRTIAISETFYEEKNTQTPGEKGLAIGVSPFLYQVNYPITREILFDREQVKIQSSFNIATDIKALANTEFMSHSYGTQVPPTLTAYGGFNITLDSGIHPVSKRPSNSVIFVTGRVPER